MALASVRGLLLNEVPKILTNKASAQQITEIYRYCDHQNIIPSTHILQDVIISGYRGIFSQLVRLTSFL